MQVPALVLFVACVALGCSKAPPPAPPRLVVLYATCSLNKDHLQPFRADVATTPAFEAFGREAVVLRSHVTEAGQSGIAFASLFSGVQADRHGAFRHPVALPDDLYLIGEAFRDAGYETYFWNGHRMGSLALNYGQGIQHGVETKLAERAAYTATDARFAAVLDGLARDPEAKAFVLVNFTLTHSPYSQYTELPDIRRFVRRLPNEARGVTEADVDRYIGIYHSSDRLPLQWDFDATVERLGLGPAEVAKLVDVLEVAYQACVVQLDHFFGRFVEMIDGAGLKDEALVAFTADHGEILYRENALYKWTHGLQLVPEDLHVPWMVRAPGLGLEPRAVDAVTRSIDVYPTLAGLCGIELPAGTVDGVDLSRALQGREPFPELTALSHSTTLGASLVELFREFEPVTRYFPREDDVEDIWVRGRRGDLEFRYRNLDGETWGMQVFDLATDPGETSNLFDASNPTHVAMQDVLLRYKARLVEGFALRWNPGGAPGAAESHEALKKLGYVR